MYEKSPAVIAAEAADKAAADKAWADKAAIDHKPWAVDHKSWEAEAKAPKTTAAEAAFVARLKIRGDSIVIVDPPAPPDPYVAYHRHVDGAKANAARANAGRSAIEVQAAINVAEAKAKADWKGSVPPPTKADAVAEKAAKDAAEKKAAEKAEVSRLTDDSIFWGT